jgi:hypothetical protein
VVDWSVVDLATRREERTTSALSRLKVDLNPLLPRSTFLDYHAFKELARFPNLMVFYSGRAQI